MALGTGLSCFYLVPALLQAKYFPVLRLLQPPFYAMDENFIRLTDLTSRGPRGGFVDLVSVTTVTVIVFIAIISLALLVKGSSNSRRLVLFWVVVCIFPVYLMSSVSLPVWRFVPSLLKGVQYPWRLNIVLCVAALYLAARFFSDAPQFPRTARLALFLSLSVIVLSWLISYGQIWRHYRSDVYTPAPRQFVSDDDGWFDAWSAPGVDQATALKASREPKVRFVDTQGTLEVGLWKARQIEFQSHSVGGWVEINQFYYPGWTAVAAASERPLEMRTVLPEGLMEVNVPPGPQQISLELPAVPGERAGGWISLASILVCVSLLRGMKPVNHGGHAGDMALPPL